MKHMIEIVVTEADFVSEDHEVVAELRRTLTVLDERVSILHGAVSMLPGSALHDVATDAERDLRVLRALIERLTTVKLI